MATPASASRSPSTRAPPRCRCSASAARSSGTLRAAARPGGEIGAFALTEPGAGSDAGSLRTRAVRDGDGGLEDHRREAVDHQRRGRRHVPALRPHRPRHGGGPRRQRLRPRRRPRPDRPPSEKLGLNSSSTVDLELDGTRRAGDRLLHEEGKGFPVAMATLDGGRIGIAAQAVGIAQAAYEVARDYAKERQPSGGPSASSRRSSGSSPTCRPRSTRPACSSTRRVAEGAGPPHTEAGAKAKLYASEVARRQTAEAIQVLGGYGYTKEFPVERYYRDAKVTEIYEGTSEIQRLVIAREILGLHARSAALEERPRPDEPVRLTRIYTRGGDRRRDEPRRRLPGGEARSADRGLRRRRRAELDARRGARAASPSSCARRSSGSRTSSSTSAPTSPPLAGPTTGCA